MGIVLGVVGFLLVWGMFSQIITEKEDKIRFEKIDEMTPQEKKEYDARQLKEYCLGKWENKISEDGQKQKEALCKDVTKS